MASLLLKSGPEYEDKRITGGSGVSQTDSGQDSCKRTKFRDTTETPKPAAEVQATIVPRANLTSSNATAKQHTEGDKQSKLTKTSEQHIESAKATQCVEPGTSEQANERPKDKPATGVSRRAGKKAGRKAKAKYSKTSASPKGASTLSEQQVSSHQWSEKPKWVLLGSGLNKAEKQQLKALQMQSGAVLVTEFSKTVTHVVCGSDEEMHGKRTMKYLLGVLNGKWIVQPSWVEANLLQGIPVREEVHEIVTDTSGMHSGPILGRMHAGLKLLKNWEVYIHDPAKTDKGLKELLDAAGARLLRRPPPDSAPLIQAGARDLQAEPHALVIFGEHASTTAFKPGTDWQGICVKRDWLLDSASNYCVQPFAQYLV